MTYALQLSDIEVAAMRAVTFDDISSGEGSCLHPERIMMLLNDYDVLKEELAKTSKPIEEAIDPKPHFKWLVPELFAADLMTRTISGDLDWQRCEDPTGAEACKLSGDVYRGVEIWAREEKELVIVADSHEEHHVLPDYGLYWTACGASARWED